MPIEVKSPYNFVPLNKKVFFPKWSKYVSQDVPLEGALSGKISLEIKTETPLFVRGKLLSEEKDGHKTFDFFRHNGKHCIPGSSIKGMLRSLVEIYSFSKLSFFDNQKYSQRDWFNENDYVKSDFRNVLGGWLQWDKTENNFTIHYNARSKPERISHEEIDDILGLKEGASFENHFSQKYIDSLPHNKKNDFQKEVKFSYYKYNYLKKVLNQEETEYVFDDELFGLPINFKSKRGILIVTGQSSTNNKLRGKKREFVFWEPENNENFKSETFSAKSDLIKNFLFTYGDNNKCIDWKKVFGDRLKNSQKIPVFITLDKRGNIAHFGLSMLYKLPYDYSIKDLLGKNAIDHLNPKEDFVQTLFGDISTENTATKGRVSFQHAFTEQEIDDDLEVRTLVLSEPRSSYYPYYIEQNYIDNTTLIDGDYYTYNDQKAIIAGRKMYPVKAKEEVNSNDANKEKISTSFKPIPAGKVFTTEISYHNLLPEELGGLLCALTLNNKKGYHQLGMAKPFGFGTVDITITNKFEEETDHFWRSLVDFRSVINTTTTEWVKTNQVTQEEIEQIDEELMIILGCKHNTPKLAYFDKVEKHALVKGKKGNRRRNIPPEPKKGLPKASSFLNKEKNLPLKETRNKALKPFFVKVVEENKKKEEALLIELEKEAIARNKKLEEQAEQRRKEEAARLKEEAEAFAKKKEEEKKDYIEKGFDNHLNEINDYNSLKVFIDNWLKKVEREILIDTETNTLDNCLVRLRNKKKPKHRKGFLNTTKKEEYKDWTGIELSEL